MNNIGGISWIELFFTDELKHCAAINSRTYLVKKSTKNRQLPLGSAGAEVEAVPQETASETIWNHHADIPLNNNLLSDKLKSELSSVDSRGCILIVCTNNKKKFVYGSKEYPMYGTIKKIVGKKANDLSHHVLTLDSKCSHDAFELIE